VYRTFPLGEAAAAHALMESSEHVGKIVLEVDARACDRPAARATAAAS